MPLFTKRAKIQFIPVHVIGDKIGITKPTITFDAGVPALGGYLTISYPWLQKADGVIFTFITLRYLVFVRVL